MEAPPLRIVTNGEFDTMDGYQWALTAAGHDERHVRQILEVKADPNFKESNPYAKKATKRAKHKKM